MCELLNRIWSRPRGEWRRVLRTELPGLAAEIVEELLHGIPGFSAFIDDNDAGGDEVLRQRVEEALLSVLGYREEEDRHDGRQEGGDEETREGVRGRASAPTGPSAQAMSLAAQDLFRALTDDRAASEASLADLAEAAGWPLPDAVRAVALATPGETQQLAAALEDALPGMFGGRPCLLLPSTDPDGRAELELPLRGRFATVGHAVPLRDAASSLRWALRLLALAPSRGSQDARAVFVDDHLSTLLLLQDEPLAHALAARWLRPLADLTPRQSERLEVTLLAWLEGGGAPEAAKALSVHPQTVRYRMRQLEKLFGPNLRDPRTRFELEMALRTRRLMAQVRRRHSRVGRRAGRVVTADFTPPLVGRMARVNGL
ncbi:helix-turn-helix domain-containing protein [Streptomyces sp. RerS4]|nr:PucR family transcriptional regulator [Streptomyces sp. RerS4]UQX04048.1 helix-turn-helix domain-containing protein [Streptomyces sp. RerS4]